MELILVRHGRTYSNVLRALDTEIPGAPLDEVGQAQARALVKRLEDQVLDVLAASPIRRTQETIAPLARQRGLQPLILPGLREIRAGKLEMSNNDADVERYFEVVAGWCRGKELGKIHEAETYASVIARFEQAIAKLCAHGKHPLAVSHGTILGAWAATRVAGVTVEMAINNHLDNTQYYKVSGEPGNWKIVHWAR